MLLRRLAIVGCTLGGCGLAVWVVAACQARSSGDPEPYVFPDVDAQPWRPAPTSQPDRSCMYGRYRYDVDASVCSPQLESIDCKRWCSWTVVVSNTCDDDGGLNGDAEAPLDASAGLEAGAPVDAGCAPCNLGRIDGFGVGTTLDLRSKACVVEPDPDRPYATRYSCSRCP